MLVKLAYGNVRRSARDFSVYFMTLAFAACLLYSFLASTDYLLALDLTPDQREAFAKAGGVLQAFAIFIDVIFCFLLAYANMFLLRRRKREFGTYLLLGMARNQVALVLIAEIAVTAVASLACGLILGWMLSPLFSLIAAFVFGVAWTPVLVVSGQAVWQCVCSFAVISVLATVLSVRGIWKRPLVDLVRLAAVPERRPLSRGGALRAQKVAAALLLAIVWGTCLLNPGYFIVFIIPLGFVALFGSYFLIRVVSSSLPRRLRAHADRYWTGLVPFTVRQLEARAETGCMAAAAECVLLAASMCMTVAGLAFSVGLRTGEFAGAGQVLLPIAYACIFYGAAFLVAAAAVLALQQLSKAVDAKASYRALAVIGTPEELLRSSLFAEVGVCFGVPAALALVHCIFGFLLIGVLSIMFGVEGVVVFMSATVALALCVLGIYYLVTVRACGRYIRYQAL